MGEFDLFESEENAIRKAAEALSGTHPDDRAVGVALSELLDQYQRLYRETRQLIKMSDRRERELNSLNKKLRQLSSALEHQARHDAMTGVLNKGTVTRTIQGFLQERNFVLALLDVDHFKKVNDTYGHLAGDGLLRNLAGLITGKLKSKDLVGRFGGEEFMIVLPDSSLEKGAATVERLRHAIEHTEFPCDGHSLHITGSFGLTWCRKGEIFEDIFSRADEALYAAKRRGRNRVELSFVDRSLRGENEISGAGAAPEWFGPASCNTGSLSRVAGSLRAPDENWPIEAREMQADVPAAFRKMQQMLMLHTMRSPLAYIEWNERFEVVDWNPAAERIFGYRKDEAIGMNIAFIVPPEIQEQVYRTAKALLTTKGGSRTTSENITKIGTRIHCEWYNAPLYDADGNTTGIFSLVDDVTDRERAQQRLDYLAYFDQLTGLPNRALLKDRLAQRMIEADRNRTLVALAFLDIDRFKDINDSLGHETGDSLLKAVAQRLKLCVREGDTVCRLGSDEFALLLPEIADAQHVALVAEKIIDAFASPFRLDQDIFVTLSMGITLYPTDHNLLKGLFKNADSALYHAKEQGRGSFEFYSPELTEKARTRLQLDTSLRQGLERGELVVHYQPQIHLGTGQIIGVEALVRWQHPELGLVPPSDFIPVAEETGLIGPIGDWVLKSACEQLMEWKADGLPPLRLAVNVSSRQLRQGFVERICELLNQTGFDPNHLELEITESVLIEHSKAMIDSLTALKAIGVSIAIDDFGTGYSSLSYLKRFPVDGLKIDRSFINDVDDADSAAIVQAIIAMAKSLRLRVVAEGVETLEQANFLLAEGCAHVQGFLFGRPSPAAEMVRQLERQSDAFMTTIGVLPLSTCVP